MKMVYKLFSIATGFSGIFIVTGINIFTAIHLSLFKM